MADQHSSEVELTVKVPDVGEGVAEVELVSWAVAEGQTVARNDIIAEVMTDKATVEVPSPTDGVIRALGGAVGDVLLVGSPLFTLATDGGGTGNADTLVGDAVGDAAPGTDQDGGDVGPAVAIAAAAPGGPASAESRSSAPRTVAVVAKPDSPAEDLGNGAGPAIGATTERPSDSGAASITSGAHGFVPRPEGRKPTASPAVRKRARDAGVDLRTVQGSGPAGRIEHQDLDALFAASPDTVDGLPGTSAASTAAGFRARNAAVSDQPIIGIRRKIAEQMVASTSTIPHITYVEEVDMTALEQLRATLNDGRPADQTKLTILPFLVRALVNELAGFPAMNAHVLEPGAEESQPKPATLRTFGGVHVGIATQTDGGLVVPVLRHAEAETVWTSASRIVQLAEAARTGSAGPADMTGSTITITSLGALGGLMTTPVINKPETTIVGVNKMVTRPVWIDGEFVPRLIMNLSCSFDHRVIDGWDAANFVQAVRRALEQPALLFVDQAPRASS